MKHFNHIRRPHTSFGLVVLNSAKPPIFEKLAAELVTKVARLAGDAIAYARSLVAARETHDEPTQQ